MLVAQREIFLQTLRKNETGNNRPVFNIYKTWIYNHYIVSKGWKSEVLEICLLQCHSAPHISLFWG